MVVEELLRKAVADLLQSLPDQQEHQEHMIMPRKQTIVLIVADVVVVDQEVKVGRREVKVDRDKKRL